MSQKRIERALLSVSDKRGLVPFAQGLEENNIEILSTGGTAKTLLAAGVKVKPVEEHTGFPEMMDGRVKTLHPKIHGGILGVRDNVAHVMAAKENGIGWVDLVAVNLYPFEATIAKPGVTFEEAIENIDIGGPSMVRSAAKNAAWVSILTDPDDYELVLEEIRKNGGVTSLETRRRLARKAFALTARYDRAIEKYLNKEAGGPEELDLRYEKIQDTRYGENPHQEGASWREVGKKGANIANAKMLHGKELSFNNIVDADASLGLVREFEEPTAVVIKHTNPCGAASAATIEDALVAAFEGDPVSAFGGILALNKPLNVKIAQFIADKKWFLEVIVCPSYDADALEILKKKQDLRLLATGEFTEEQDKQVLRSIEGGLVTQTPDRLNAEEKDLRVVSQAQPTPEQIESMLFANKIAKHVKSNAIVLVNGKVVVGVGAGQMSRVESVKIACSKAGEKAKGSVLAGDAFFPFPDGVEHAIQNGVVAIIQPGGSKKDAESTAMADQHNVVMAHCGQRHFKH